MTQAQDEYLEVAHAASLRAAPGRRGGVARGGNICAAVGFAWRKTR